MRTIVLLLVVMAAAGARAEAQPAPWQPDRLTAGWVFTPGVAMGALWDNNVTVRNQGNPLIEEWVGLVNPRGELTFNGRRTRFSAGYSGALETYRTLDALNRYEQRGRISAQHQTTSRLVFEARAAYTRTPTTDRLELGPLPFIDIGTRALDAGASSTIALSPRTSVVADYQFQQVEFDREADPTRAAFLEGGHSHRPGLTVRRQLARRIGIGANWQYRHAIINGGETVFDVQDMLGDVSYQFGPSTTVRGAAGAAHLSVPSTGLDLWGPSFRAEFEHQLARSSVTARYSRTFVPSFSFGGLTGNQNLGVSVRVPLTAGGRLVLNGSTTYSRTEPVEALGLGFQLDSLWFQGSLGYQLAPWLRTEGFVASMHQESTARGNIDRTRIGIQFVTSKPVRIE